jgi:glycosyltransferase involved in cell wall biosynthesis
VQLTKRRYRLWNGLMRPLSNLDTRTVAAAHSVAVPSPSVGRDLLEFYGREPVLLPLGVDTGQLRPGGTRGDHLLFVGRLAETYKHLDWAIEVARRIGRPLHVAGEGRIPESQADVTSLGYLEGDALAEAYRSAAVLLFPSVHEDFGLVPLEAMACGLPVVAWDDDHGPSLTMTEGSGGRLVPAYDLDAFTATVTSLLEDSDQHAKLSAAGPRWVEQHFSLQRHIDGLEELLEAAAAAKGKLRREDAVR